jgi:predicted dienelactone hydrolase
MNVLSAIIFMLKRTSQAIACLGFMSIAQQVHAQVGLRELQAGTLKISVSYPTDASNTTQNQGPFEIPSAPNAAPKRGNGRLIVMSHGTAGAWQPDFALASALVRGGYIVAQPLHLGDNYMDNSKAGPESWKTRPKEISQSIDALKADAQLGPLFDENRVGVHGMSAGGHTALVMAGAQWNMLSMIKHCAATGTADDGFCLNGLAGKPQEQAKRKASFAQGAKAPELFLPSELKRLHGGKAEADPRPDARVQAVSLAVPVASLFTPQSLASIRVPVGIVRAGKDELLEPKFHSDYALANCKSCKLIVSIDKAGHFDLLWPWPTSVAADVAKQQIRGAEVNPSFTSAEREAMQQKVVAFFNDILR